ncbi:MAG: hypothetical protein JSV61_02420 [Anaerolineales bacterium]|nr:MAG: hypothetical protein JSV61_02420 [Anaerolineales bacterium]
MPKIRIPVGAHDQESRSTADVQRFLSFIRFEQREKLEELELEINTEAINLND